jgi:hypothetical protein
MNDHVADEARLRRLLSDAVSDIEPENRLDELRASVHPSPRVVPMSRPRSWYAAAGIVATAAVIGVVAYVTSVVGDQGSSLGPATDSGTTLPTGTTATDPAASPDPDQRPQGRPMAVYFLGHGPHGDVLYHETVPVSSGAKPLDLAVSALTSDPSDPDYRTGWRPGALVSATVRHGLVRVVVGPGTAARPAHMSPRTASEIVQQAVWTFQGVSGRPNALVQFVRHGAPATSVFGVPATRPIGPGRVVDVLSLMNIATPSYDGQRFAPGRLVVSGTSNGFEGTVVVKLVRPTASGPKTVLTEPGQASGWGDPDRLYPWKVTLDTSTLPPGPYLVVATDDDPSGHGRPATDTRVVVLR